MLNDAEMNHVIGLLISHVMPTPNIKLDKQDTTKLLIKLMNTSHRDVVIDYLQLVHRKETA